MLVRLIIVVVTAMNFAAVEARAEFSDPERSMFFGVCIPGCLKSGISQAQCSQYCECTLSAVAQVYASQADMSRAQASHPQEYQQWMNGIAQTCAQRLQ